MEIIVEDTIMASKYAGAILTQSRRKINMNKEKLNVIMKELEKDKKTNTHFWN